MSSKIKITLAAAMLAAPVAVPTAPVFAQRNTNEQVLVIFGNDACPRDTICVRRSEGERYRIPPNLRESDDPANEPWTNRVKSMETVGNFGTMSCSASGYGGWSGCTKQLIEQAYAEKRAGPGVKAAELIAQERAKRLSTIDADAAAEQARVEQLEKEYDAKMQAEADAAEAAKSGDTQGNQ